MSPCHALEGGGFVCTPTYKRVEKRRRVCPTCKKRRTMVGFFEEWYGWTVTCLGCGDSWMDGERMERPFERGWRKRSIANARDLFKRVREGVEGHGDNRKQ